MVWVKIRMGVMSVKLCMFIMVIPKCVFFGQWVFREIGVSFWNNRLLGKWASDPLGHFLDYCCFGIMGSLSIGTAPKSQTNM